MLMPKKIKYRKQHRGNFNGCFTANRIVFGDFALQAIEGGWLTSRQIEATRRSMIRYVRKIGIIWIRVFPDKPITERPSESRMGSGKGSLAYWVAVVKPGKVIFELAGISDLVSHRILLLASAKLPLKTKIIKSQ